MEQIEVRVSSRNFGCRVRQRRRREMRGVNYNNLTRISINLLVVYYKSGVLIG